MFESLVASLLNKYIGKYVANIDSSNLNVSVLKGDVELSDLQLRPEALAELNLPIEVKAGYVGLLKLDIPWTNLFSADIDVSVENVYILAGPVTDRQYDPERERQLQNAIKRQLLDTLENSPLQNVASKAEEDPTLFEKLTQNLINRVQISVRHIHIRYEDTVTNPDHPFACGIMLKQILLCSTDSKWEPRGTCTSPNMLHKLLKLDDLSVYWNPYIPEQHLLRSRLNTDGWRNLLRMSIDSHNIFEEEFDFIIEPVAAQARLIVCTENGFTLPKVFADFTLEEIEILLSRQQFLNLLTLNDSFQMMRINQRYRKYHPNVSLKVSPRSWWVYAYTAVLEEVIRPYSWERIKEHRSRYKKYKSLYKKGLELGDLESQRGKLWELEESLDVTNILMARQQARLEFSLEAPERARRKKERASRGWFSSWFGSSDDEEDIEVDSEPGDWLDNLNEEERESLFKAIGYDRNSNLTGYPREFVAHKVQLIVKSCCVSLVNYSKKILQMSVSHLITTWENRPGAEAFRVSCNTESFAIEGASIEHELIPILTSDIGVYAPSVNQVFTVDFEVKPLYIEADYSLSLNVQPVEIVYDEHSLSEVSAFFQVPHGSVDLRSTAVNTFQEVARYSRAGLQYAIDQHTTIHIALNMRSPYIVIPEFGTLHRGGNVLIVDFGTLRIESELQPKDVSLEDATMSEIESRLYDQFNITVKDVKVLLADSGDDWHTAQIQPNSDFHVLPSVQLLLTFFSAVKPDYKQLPRQKFEARVPSLEVNISDKRLLLLMSFLRNFPVPASTSMVTIGDDVVDGMGPTIAPIFAFDITEAQLDPDIASLRRIKRSILGRHMMEMNDLPASASPSKPSNRASSGEDVFLSASDHSDEDLEHFSEEDNLGNFSEGLHIKPVDDNSSPSNTVNVLLRMSLNEFVVNMSKVMDKQVRPYLMLRVDRLRIDSAVTEHGYAAHATLGGIQLVDKIHVGSSGEYMEVLRTEPKNNLVSVMYRMVDPECPDFASDYGSMEHAMKVKFHSIALLLDQASLMYLHAFVQGLISSVQNLDMKTSTSSVITTSDVSTKDRSSLTDRLTSITDEVDKLPPLSTKLNLTAELSDVTVRLCDSDNSLAQIQISGLESSALVKSVRTIVRARLRDFSIEDCSVGAIYPKILMIEDKTGSLFDLKFVKYNKGSDNLLDNKKRRGAIDHSIRLRVGHLQTVYLGKFYWELTRFFEPFVNKEMTQTATQVAVETVQKQVEDIQTQNLRVAVNVDLQTPTILVPRHSKSIDMLMVELGDLSVKNYFNFTNIPPDMRQEWNHIYLNLHHIQVKSVRLNLADDKYEVLHTILEPIAFKADIRVAMKPIFSETRMDVSGHLEKVKLNILQRDLQLLIGLTTENLLEGAPAPSPGLYESPTIQNLEEKASVETETTAAPESRNDSIESEQKTSTNVLLRLEGLSAILFEEKETDQARWVKTSLCLVDVEKLNINALHQSDGDLKVNFSLQSLVVDDTRPDSTLAVPRILYCPKKQKTSEEFPLVSLIYKVSSDGNQKADLMVEKLRLNVHIPFMLVLVDFFTAAVDTGILIDTPDLPSAPRPAARADNSASANGASTAFNVYGSFKQPEIVVFTDPSSAESRVFAIYSEVVFEYRADVEQQVLWAKVSNLHIHSCQSAQRPSASASQVMAPCSIEFRQTYDLEKRVREMNASVSSVKVFLSATVMAMLWDIASHMQLSSTKQSSPAAEKPEELSNLWGISAVTSEKWLRDKLDYGNVRRELHPPDQPEEILKVDVKEVSAFFEIVNLDHHIPILCLRSSLDASIKDWSKKLYLEAELHLDMMYYNEKLSTWEPLIEPVMEKEGLYRPWEVLIKVARAKSFPMLCMYEDHDLDIPDGLQSEVQEMMHRARVRSSSSETDTDSSSDMTVIRHKSLRRVRHGSERSYGMRV